VWGAILLTLATVLSTRGYAQSSGSQPVYTRDTEFAIPFRSDDAEIQRLGAGEVRLFVSVDGGQNWQQVQSVRPDIRRFRVRAPKDGEYWFAVRTVGRDNRLHPRRPMTAELKVVVDTTAPSLNLRLSEPKAGTVRLKWTAEDSHLDAKSLELESRHAGDKTWQRVFVAQRPSGTTTWEVPQGGRVRVRGRIKDRASNTAEAEESIRISAAKQSVPRPEAPNLSEPIARRQANRPDDRNLPNLFPGNGNAADDFPADNHQRQQRRLPRNRREDGPAFIPARQDGSNNTHTTQGRSAANGGSSSARSGPMIVPNGRPSLPNLQPRPNSQPQPSSLRQQPRLSRNGTKGTSSQSGPDMSFSRFPPASQHTGQTSKTTGRAAQNTGKVTQNSTPSGKTTPVRLVNGREFRLNYAIEKVGKSGVQSVELFITPNGGRKWYLYGTDDDQSSPFPVKVPDDGTYGFAIRVKSGVGLSEPPPQSGEKPAMVVVVDQTAPRVELMPVLQGRGENSNQFLIRWTTTDPNPADKAIAVSYAESPDGPWTTISSWKEDTGRFLWTTPENVPPKVYLRVAARDAAGNVAHAQTPRPIIVDVVKPSARITNVDVEAAER